MIACASDPVIAPRGPSCSSLRCAIRAGLNLFVICANCQVRHRSPGVVRQAVEVPHSVDAGDRLIRSDRATSEGRRDAERGTPVGPAQIGQFRGSAGKVVDDLE